MMALGEKETKDYVDVSIETNAFFKFYKSFSFSFTKIGAEQFIISIIGKNGNIRSYVGHCMVQTGRITLFFINLSHHQLTISVCVVVGHDRERSGVGAN